jgi:hypothetical protein
MPVREANVRGYNAALGTVSLRCRERDVVGHKTGRNVTLTFDVLDFIAAVLDHVPARNAQVVRFYGAYSNRGRGARKRRLGRDGIEVVDGRPEEKARLEEEDRNWKSSWRKHIWKAFGYDPLLCPACGAEMEFRELVTINIAECLMELRRNIPGIAMVCDDG